MAALSYYLNLFIFVSGASSETLPSLSHPTTVDLPNAQRFISVSESHYDHDHHTHDHHHEEVLPPHFDMMHDNHTNSIVYLGTVATLDCIIHNPGNESVST